MRRLFSNAAWTALISSLVFACAEQPDGPLDDKTDRASSALVSGSFGILTVAQVGSFDVAWECGVGLLVWVQGEPTYDRIMGLRFDEQGNHLDPAPFLIVEQDVPQPPDPSGVVTVVNRSIGGVFLERSNLGFFLVYQDNESFVWTSPAWSGGSHSARAVIIGTDGTVGPYQILTGVSDWNSGSSTTLGQLNIARTSFDGDQAFVLVNTNSLGAVSSASSFVYRQDGVLVTALSGNNLTIQPPVRGFGCGFGRCLLFGNGPVGTVERVYADTTLVEEKLNSPSPIQGSHVVALESCEFLTPSTLVDGLSVVGGPHSLPAGGHFLHDGASAIHYFNSGGLSSHTFAAADGAPVGATVEDASLTISGGDAVASMGDGKAIWVTRVGDTFVARYLGPGANTPVDGQCDPDGDAGLVSGLAPDCVSGGGGGSGGAGGNGGTAAGAGGSGGEHFGGAGGDGGAATGAGGSGGERFGGAGGDGGAATGAGGSGGEHPGDAGDDGGGGGSGQNVGASGGVGASTGGSGGQNTGSASAGAGGAAPNSGGRNAGGGAGDSADGCSCNLAQPSPSHSGGFIMLALALLAPVRFGNRLRVAALLKHRRVKWSV